LILSESVTKGNREVLAMLIEVEIRSGRRAEARRTPLRMSTERWYRGFLAAGIYPAHMFLEPLCRLQHFLYSANMK
jgi:hypothetical protein